MYEMVWRSSPTYVRRQYCRHLWHSQVSYKVSISNTRVIFNNHHNRIQAEAFVVALEQRFQCSLVGLLSGMSSFQSWLCGDGILYVCSCTIQWTYQWIRSRCQRPWRLVRYSEGEDKRYYMKTSIQPSKHTTSFWRRKRRNNVVCFNGNMKTSLTKLNTTWNHKTNSWTKYTNPMQWPKIKFNWKRNILFLTMTWISQVEILLHV